MTKTEWKSPKLEILSTRRTAAGGGGLIDGFHTDDSLITNPQAATRPTVS